MKFTDLVHQVVSENVYKDNIEKNSLGATGTVATNSGIYASAATGTTATVLGATSYSGTSLGSFAMASTGSGSSAGADAGYNGECDLTDSKILKKRKLLLPTKNIKLKKA